VAIELEPADQLFAEVTAHAFAQHRHGGVDLDALDITVPGLAVAADAHVADDHPADRAVLPEVDAGGGIAGKQVDFQRLGARRQPAAHRPQGDDEVAVVLLLRGGGQAVPFRWLQQPDFVPFDGNADRRRVIAPVGQQPIERFGFDHGAGQDVGADFRTLLDDRDHQFRLDLLQANRTGQAGRTGAYDDHVVFHDFAFAHAALPPGRHCA
jgi:hypothetical protein